MDVVVIAISAFLPRVEDPWPDEIGLDLPFVLAGIFGVLAEFRFGGAPAQQRDQAIHAWGLCGLYAGTGLYAVSLAAQVVS